MMWIVLTILVAQKVNFGVIAGASLTPDFHDLNCTFPIDAFASAAPGCPRIIGAESLMVSDASKRFILGPKVDIHLSRSFSVEVDALRRAIRSHTTWVVPPLVLPDGRVLPTPPTLSGAGAEFTWEFPVLAKYQFFAPRMNPFIEVGPSFRPAENRELYGVTAGAGVEIHLRTVNVTPALRYNHWKHNGRYFAWNANQFQFILGMDRKSSSDSVSAFGYHLSL